MVYALIMAGESGTRFWPRSRRAEPKQLLRIADERTMIRATVERIAPEVPADRIMVVTGASHQGGIWEELPELSAEMIVVELESRNTGLCIARAASKIRNRDPDAPMVVLPAEHLVEKEREFLKAVRIGIEAVSKEKCLLTFGIVPRRPETGYGYIKLGPPHLEIRASHVYRVDRFLQAVAKPRSSSKRAISGMK